VSRHSSDNGRGFCRLNRRRSGRPIISRQVFGRRPVDRGHKPVTTPRHCLDKLHTTGTLTQCLAQQRNVLSQISFFNKCVWPDALHQVVFGDDLSAVFNERQQYVEYFRREGNDVAFPQQDTFRDIQAEATKIITKIVLLPHKTGL
jgi:hypothetical protein